MASRNVGKLLLTDYMGKIIRLASYETEDELRSVVKRLGAEMDRTGIEILGQPGMDKILKNLFDSD